MSLTVGPGPFGPHNSGAFNPDTGAPGGHTLYRRGSPQRVRATFNGETVVDRDSNVRTHIYAVTEILEVPTDLSATAPLGGRRGLVAGAHRGLRGLLDRGAQLERPLRGARPEGPLKGFAARVRFSEPRQKTAGCRA